MHKAKLNKYNERIVFQENTDGTINYGLAQHDVCNGFIDCEPISNTHQALNCRKCNLRFVFPIGIKTIKELHQFTKAVIKQEQE